MKVVIRVDSSAEIGTGHFMRCLTLANEIGNTGGHCHFISRDLGQHFINLLATYNHSFSPLPKSCDTNGKARKKLSAISKSNAWLPLPSREDAQQTIKLLNNNKPDVLLIDHYGIDNSWHRELRPFANKIFVIDDLADRQLDCDLLLNQTFGMSSEDYMTLLDNQCKQLIGSKYALLRPEFLDLRSKAIEKRNNNTSIHKVLVFLGGGFHSANISVVLDTLNQLNWKKKPIIDLILNREDPVISKLNSGDLSFPFKINLLFNATNVAQLMLEADFSIGSAGSTSWERCSLGLPSLVSIAAENQQNIAANLENIGAIYLWKTVEELKTVATKLIASGRLLKQMSTSAFKVCDGLGVQRVVTCLKEFI